MTGDCFGRKREKVRPRPIESEWEVRTILYGMKGGGEKKNNNERIQTKPSKPKKKEEEEEEKEGQMWETRTRTRAPTDEGASDATSTSMFVMLRVVRESFCP